MQTVKKVRRSSLKMALLSSSTEDAGITATAELTLLLWLTVLCLIAAGSNRNKAKQQQAVLGGLGRIESQGP